MLGRPTYVGGTKPTSYRGFALADSSPGFRNASDGLDRGARIRGDVGPGASPATTTATTVAKRRRVPIIRVRSTLRSIAKTGKLKLFVRTPVAGTITLTSTLQPGATLSPKLRGHSRKPIDLRTVTPRFTRTRERMITIKVGPRTRRTLGRSRSCRLSIQTYADPHRRHRTGSQEFRIRR
jgi:hypothetical protein